MTTAFYPGSFDPVTNGHLDVLEHAFAVAQTVVVGIGVHPGKTPLFSFKERETMLREAMGERAMEGTLSVVSFEDLVIHAAARHGATLLIRGLRDGTDLDYEMQMAGMNRTLAPAITTVFLPASAEVRHITATLVRQIAKLGGDVGPFVPPHVATMLKLRADSAR